MSQSNPPSVRLTQQAQEDIRQITEYYLAHTEPAVATRNIATIISKCRYLAENSFIGRKLDGLDDSYQFWTTNNHKHVIYFKRTGPRSIKILRVWGATRLPLGVEEILSADE